MIGNALYQEYRQCGPRIYYDEVADMLDRIIEQYRQVAAEINVVSYSDQVAEINSLLLQKKQK